MANTNNKELTNKKINEAEVSAYAYDVALVEDLRARFKKTDKDVKGSQINSTVQIGSSQRAFEILGTLNDDEVIMPFISLERLNWSLGDIQSYQTFTGGTVFTGSDNEGNKLTKRAQVIPISINWKLSVYSKDRITNDAILRELIFYYTLRPSLLVKVGHGLNMAHKFNIYFDSNIEDNSDIANHDLNGTYYRQDVGIYTEDAYLWRANYEQTVEILPDLHFDYGIMSDNE